MKVASVLWYEWILFKNRFWGVTLGFMISPILYLIAFGWGLGDITVAGMSYINYVIPGIVAMSSMTTSYGTVANSINISRTYDKTFEEFMTSPIHMASFTLGKILASAIRGMYAAGLILVIISIFSSALTINIYFILIIVLNCLVFSSLGFLIGMIINSHADMSKFQNFIITPMSFLCGTFFPIDKMPAVIKQIVWILPLTQTSIALRRTSGMYLNAWIHPLILAVYFAILLTIGIMLCKKTE